MSDYLQLKTSSEYGNEIAARARSLRLQRNIRQVTLAERSGVSLASVKRFESTGQISFSSLLKIANALGCLDDFSALFLPEPAVTISDLEKNEKKKQRCRGRA